MGVLPRALWWTGSVVATAAIVSLFLTDWHWDSLVAKARFAIFKPEIAGFRTPYPNCEIAQNGISPNGQFAFVVGYALDDRTANPPNCLIVRSHPEQYFPLPTEIDASTMTREGFGGVVRWAKDSSAVLIFKNNSNFGGGAYDIYIVPLTGGKPGKITNLEAEIYKIPHDDFVKDHAAEMNDMAHIPYEIQDGNQPDDLTFNDLNQVVIDCVCTNDPNDNPNDLVLVKGWSAHVTGLWDPIQCKFVKSNYQVIPISK